MIELKSMDFTMEERDFYCRLEADSRAQFEEYAAVGTVKQNYVNILLTLLRLQQVCDHPLLVKGYNTSSAWRSSVKMAKKLPREKQVGLIGCLEASLAICGLCNGYNTSSAWRSSVEMAKKLPREKQVGLIGCLEDSLAICGLCNDPPEDIVVTSCGHVFCNQCICENLTGDDKQCPTKNCKDRLSTSLVFSRDSLKCSLSQEPGHDITHNSSGSEVSNKLESSSWGPPFVSSKIRTALKLLESLSKPKPSTDYVAALPNKSHDPFAMEEELAEIDDDRDTNLVEASKEMVTVIIMSLKAASLGLNMVVACHVILLDLWWNPTTEDQAVDRAHRIGQTRHVFVLRLTVKDTIKDRILALQQKKREMVASAFGEDEMGSNQTRLTVEDLKILFMA